MTEQAKRLRGHLRQSNRGTSVSTLLFVAIAILFVLGATAYSQTYPRCITGCTAKDVTLENVYLITSGGGTPGVAIDADIIATVNFNRVNSYCVRIVADVYIDDVLAQQDMVSQPYVFRAKGLYDLLLGTISWPYGSVLELRNIQIFWSVDNSLNDPSLCVGCVDYGPGSKCVGYASVSVTQPLVANFEGIPLLGCAPLQVQFTDLSSGGYSIDPYTYDWDFGDGSAHSTAENPVHTYENPGSYTVSLTVSDTEANSDTETKIAYVVVQDCGTDLYVTKTEDLDPISVGSTLTYTIIAGNSGPGDASGVQVSESIPTGTSYVNASPSQGSYDSVLGVWSIGTLFLGEEATLVLEVLVEETAGETITNTVCVSGNESDPNPLNNCDTTTTTVEHNPVLLVEKSGTPSTAVVGETVNYTVAVSHDPASDGSPVNITTVTDSLGIALALSSGDDGDGLLEVGETWIYTGSREVLPDDPSSLVNEACVYGEDFEGDPVQDCDSTTTIVDHNPALLVQKSGLPTTAAIGDVVSYTITVQHHESSDGSPVDITAVSDSLGIALSGPSGDDGDGLLEASEIWIYTGLRVVLPDDPHELVNTVCISGLDLDGEPVSDCDSTTTIVEHAPVLLVQKSGLPTTASVGDIVNYTITVAHDPASDGSPVDITTVTDSLGIVLSGPAGDDGDGFLESGETWTYTGSREVLPTDLRDLVNEVCVEGEDLDGDLVDDCDSTTTTVEHAPVLLVEKSGVPSIADVGNIIIYTITVQHDPNSDNSPIHVTSVNDSLGIALSGPYGDDSDGYLEEGEVWTYTGSREVLPSDPVSLINEACVEGHDLDGDTVSDCGDTTTTVRHNPLLQVEKTGDPVAAATGDTVTYTITVQHNVASDGSPVDITSVNDSLGIVLSGPSGDDGDGLLESNETWTYTGSRVVLSEDPHELVNTVCVTGEDLDGEPLSDCDSTTTIVEHNPCISLEKTGPESACIGDEVTYHFRVENCGDIVLHTGAHVYDPLINPDGDHEIWDGILQPGDVVEFDRTYTIQSGDPDPLVNTATAIGHPPGYSAVEDTATWTIDLAGADLMISKSEDQNPVAAGDLLTYTITVTNNGPCNASSVVVTDTLPNGVTYSDHTVTKGTYVNGIWTVGSLGNGQSETLSLEVFVNLETEGPITNIACVEGSPTDPNPNNNCDSTTTTVEHTPVLLVEKTGDPIAAAVGDTVNYTITVQHDVASDGSPVDITSVNDSLAIALSGPSGDDGDGLLESNETWTYTGSRVVLASDPHQLTNTVCVEGEDLDGDLVDDCDSTTTTISHPDIDLEKTADVAFANIGDTITYTYTVENTGDVDLYGVTLSDDILGSIPGPASGDDGDGILETNEIWLYEKTHLVVEGDLPGPLVNEAVATGTPLVGETVSDSDTESVLLTSQPAIEVIKDASDGPFAVGDTITYTYTVTNTGDVTLTGITVVDDILGPISLGTTTLAPDVSTTGTSTHVVTQADVDAGSIVNVATATGTPPSGPPVTDEEDETVTFGQTPAIEVIKDASDGPFVVGDTITYTYTVTNTGNVTLTSISVVDDILGPISLGTTTLAPAASTSGTASHLVTQADVDTGSIVNVATATGTPPIGPPVTDEEDETVTFGQTPAIEVIKDASDGPFVVGDTITYTYTITNTGNVTLTSISVVDDILGPISLGTTTLAPAASTSGTASHLVTQADVDTGSIVNVATGTGTPPIGPPVTDEEDETVTFGQTPSIEVVKDASDGPFAVGDTITYTYTVTNTGNVTLTSISVVDDILGSISLGATMLPPNASTTGTATHLVTQADIDAGSITNVATATGTPPIGPPVTDEEDETVTFGQTPAIEVVKDASDGPFVVGDTITYTYTVTNIGGVTLSGITLVDDILGSISLGATMLPPNASTTGTATHLVTQADVDTGSIVNVATATGTPPVGPPVTDEEDETVTFGQTPSIEVVKDASDGPFVVGDTITYTYTITNTGNVTLTSISVVDDILGPISLGVTTLTPAAFTAGTASHLVTQADVDTGSIVNVATATGTPPSGPPVTDEEDETVTFGQTPTIEVVKDASDGPFVVGDTIAYTYTVTNTGNVTLTDITVVDDILGPISLGTTTLAPAASTAGTASHLVTQADVDTGSIVNVATATGTPPSGPPITDEEDETVTFGQTPSIEVIKDASDGPFVVGDTITYTYTVTNTGNVTLTSISVVDDILGPISLGTTTLAPAASTSGTASHLVTQADVDTGSIVNVATATGTPPVGPPVADEEDETVTFGQTPAIEVIKDADYTTPIAVGDTITYTYTVRNTGNVTLTNVSAIDDPLGAVTLATTTLPPGAETTGTLTATVTQAHIDAGMIGNTVLASGTPPVGDPVTDDDAVTVNITQGPELQIEKSGPPMATIGQQITYSITVRNTGNITLHNVRISDPLLGLDQSVGDMVPQASVTLNPSYTVVESDFPGPLLNTATADSAETPSVQDSHSIAIPTDPSVSGRVWDDVNRNEIIDPGENGIGELTIRLLDETGTIILRSKETNPDGTYIFNAVTPGSYVVDVDELDPQMPFDYTPTYIPSMPIIVVAAVTDVDFGFAPPLEELGTIGDYVWNDVNGDGLQDEVGLGIPGVRLMLRDSQGAFLQETSTDSFGNYYFTDLPKGNYLVEIDLASPSLAHLAPTTSTVVSATIASNDLDADFGLRLSVIDLSLTKTVDNVNPEVGELVTFEIIIANGPDFADATDVEVTDTLPAGYAFVGFAVSQGTYAYTGLNSLWIVGDLPAGSSATLQVFATVLEDGPYKSPAEVTAADQDDIDSVPANANLLSEDDDDEATVFIDTPIADLLVTKTVDNANPDEEDTVIFTITVYNGGPYTSTGIILQDALPAGLTYLSDTSGGSYNPATNAWDVGTLIVGESTSFTLSALVDVGTAGTTLTNTALVIQNEVDDPSPANNQDSADVTVGESGGGGGATEECEGKVIISEIAWAGTAANPEDEWIELRNIGGEPVDLTGWILRWRKKQPVTPEDFQWKIVPLSGELPASTKPVCELTHREPEPTVEFIKREVDDLSWFVVARPVDYDESYMILERKSDLTISNVDADIIYDDLAPYTMELSDDGDIIELVNADGNIVDTANAFPSYNGNWPAGDALTLGTMERIDPLGPDERDNWHTNLGIITWGLDATGRPLVASSDVINSQTLEEMELFIKLNAVKTLPGARLEVGLDLSREVRRETGWPWIRITRPGYDATADAAGGGGGIEPAYSFASRYANDTYWLGIDTGGLVPGDYFVWVVYGEGQTVLVPITILH